MTYQIAVSTKSKSPDDVDLFSPNQSSHTIIKWPCSSLETTADSSPLLTYWDIYWLSSCVIWESAPSPLDNYTPGFGFFPSFGGYNSEMLIFHKTSSTKHLPLSIDPTRDEVAVHFTVDFPGSRSASAIISQSVIQHKWDTWKEGTQWFKDSHHFRCLNGTGTLSLQNVRASLGQMGMVSCKVTLSLLVKHDLKLTLILSESSSRTYRRSSVVDGLSTCFLQYRLKTRRQDTVPEVCISLRFIRRTLSWIIQVWSTPATLLEWESSQVYNPQDFKTAFLYVT